MKTRTIKSVLSILTISFFLALAMGCGSNKSGPDIEDENGIKEHIKGKWSTTSYEGGTTWYYRFEITETKLKYWSRFGEWEWKEKPEGVHSYKLSHVIRDPNGVKFRGLIIEEVDLGLRSAGTFSYENGCLRVSRKCLDKGW